MFNPREAHMAFVVDKVTGVRFSSEYSEYPFFTSVSIIPPIPHIRLHLHVSLTRKAKGQSLETFRKAMLFGITGRVGYKNSSTFFLFIKD
jgi:hypothetical protein